MTTLPGSPDGKGMTITANAAYVLTKHGGRLEDEYEMVGSPPGGFVDVVPSPPPPSHQLLLPPPVATPTSGNIVGASEEAVYEPVPGDR